MFCSHDQTNFTHSSYQSEIEISSAFVWFALRMTDFTSLSAAETGAPTRITTKFGSYQVIWTNGVVNLCFLALYTSFQFNACVLFKKLEYRTFSMGFVLFTLATVMELCLLIQPPQLMKWIPFWNNSFGRGVALCIVSVISLNGYFLVGCVSLAVSFLVTVSSAFTGSYEVALPILSYGAIFNDPPPRALSNDSLANNAKGKYGDNNVPFQSYQGIADYDLEE